MLETVTCDSCNSADFSFVTKQTDLLHMTTDEYFNIVCCNNCGLHFTNPRPTQATIAKYYANTYSFHQAPSYLKLYFRFFAEKLANSPFCFLADLVPSLGKKVAAYIKPHIQDPVMLFYKSGGQGTFLDIGCGGGASAHFWGAKGALLWYRKYIEVAGVEVSEDAFNALQRANIEAWQSLSSIPDSRMFGMIRMNWSLEHVHSPNDYFAFIAQRLLPKGQAVIAVPNYSGLIYCVAKSCVELPIHLYHFTPNDIERYAERHNMKVVKLITFSYPAMFYEAVRSALIPKAFSSASGVIASKKFQSVLNQFDAVNMGNDLIAILEKK